MFFLKKITVGAVALLLSIVVAQAQPNVFRSFSLTIAADTTKLDTLSMVPHSLVLRDAQGRIIPDSLYQVDFANSLLISDLKNKLVSVSFRSFPFSFTKPYLNKEHASYLSGDTILSTPNPFFVPQNYRSQRDGLLSNSGLEHSGSLMRGINVSTNSSASLTSELTLQLSGKLTEELNLLATISDKNLPALPEGNTASLQEFDKMFISIYTQNTSLSAGDVELTEAHDFFGKYNRKALGAAFSTRKEGENFTYQTTTSAGVAKGKFARQNLVVSDANQGPYLLYGAENESNIVVLSGSERVYADGVLLERGTDADYTISYTTAEITFMPRHVVSSRVRITVEFEYSERSYARYLANTQHNFTLKKGRVYINAFYEGDAKNQAIDEDLSDEQKQLMANVGSQYWQAFAPSVDSIAYNNNEILYRKKDTVSNGAAYQIYEYSTNPQEAHFRLRFSAIEGGSYALANSAANGRVYVWVGQGNGSYEPAQMLATPKRKFLLTAGGAFHPDSLSSIALDAALSNSSVNLFASDVDKTGFGMRLIGEKMQPVGKSTLSASASALLFDKKFDAPERFVDIEYERDWNIEGGMLGRDFQEYSGRLGYQLANKFSINATGSMLTLGATSALASSLDTSFSAMQGGKVQGDFRLQVQRLNGIGNVSFLRTEQDDRGTQFFRGKGEVAQSFWKLTAGVRGEFEHNEIKTNEQLQANSAAFHSEEIFLRTDSSKHKLGIMAKTRTDFVPQNGELEEFMKSRELGATSEVNGKMLRNRLTASYRHVEYKDSSTTENAVIGREEISGMFARGAINTSVMYELGSGMELKQDFMYVEVGTGQGAYAWRDYNNNGVKELNEFEIAAFRDEASYIRVALPTQEYTPVYTGKFAFQLSLNPGMIWRQSGGIKGFISQFRNAFSFSNSHKNLRNNFAKNANPFSNQSLSDTGVVSQSYALVNTLTYLSPSARTKLEFAWQNNMAKSMLINGFESRQNNITELNAQQRVTDILLLQSGLERGIKQYDAQYAAAGTSYDILQRSLSAGSEITPIMHLRINATYKFSDKRNRAATEKAQLHDAQLMGTYNIPQKGVLTANLGFVSTSFNGESNGSVGYEMLQGYGTGNNITWGATFKRLLGNGLEFNLLYSGRRLPTSKVIHSGSVELRLLF